MLAATITFIRDELGIENIFYHTAHTGHKLKRIGGGKPPRSLYSQLPKRFCFGKVKTAPEFLMQDKYFRRVHKKINNPEFYYLKL